MLLISVDYIDVFKVPLFDDYRVKNINYNHLDFNIGRQAGYYVYTRVLEILRRCDLGKTQIQLSMDTIYI